MISVLLSQSGNHSFIYLAKEFIRESRLNLANGGKDTDYTVLLGKLCTFVE